MFVATCNTKKVNTWWKTTQIVTSIFYLRNIDYKYSKYILPFSWPSILRLIQRFLHDGSTTVTLISDSRMSWSSVTKWTLCISSSSNLKRSLIVAYISEFCNTSTLFSGSLPRRKIAWISESIFCSELASISAKLVQIWCASM